MTDARFAGPDATMEGIRQAVEEIVADQDEHPERHEGKWRLEADLHHNPVPWANGIVTSEVEFVLGRDEAELLLGELGYRAAWRLGCETDYGYMTRFRRGLLQQCRDESHHMVEMTGGWSDYARERGFTKHCPRCGHTDGPNCHCSFCGPRGRKLSAVEDPR